MKKKLIFFLALFSFFGGFSQKETSIWYFGEEVGLDFNSGEPKLSNNGKLISSEGSASISTKDGRLLFYTEGVNVWDSSHNLMPNGSNLSGNESSTQSSIIIPKPGDKKKFYIFTVDHGNVNKGLCYSEIDMDLNSGFGDIVSGKKNIQLTSQTCEKLAATYHSNGKDIWVLIHKFYTTDSIYAYLITQAGVQSKPVTSATGFWAPYSLAGQMKISPDGKKIALAHYATLAIVGDFNSSTGKTSNMWALTYPSYGLEFSASGNFLYTKNGLDLLQYDLRSKNPKTIISSEKKVGRNSMSQLFWAFQLGPDGKIYIANNDKSIDIIHSPDVEGTNCRFENNFVDLGNKYCGLGLPNFISSFFNWINFGVKGTCLNDTIRFTIPDLKSSDSLKWDFGDPGSGSNNYSSKYQNVYHIYTKKGRYKISLTSYRGTQVIKGFQYIDINPPANFLNDNFICKGDTLQLEPNTKFETYKWSTGAQSKIIKVQKEGIYMLEVRDSNNCLGRDTATISEIYDKPSLGPDAFICENHTLEIGPDKSYNSYIWSNDSITKSLRVNGAGTYILTVLDSFGCKFSDTIVTKLANLHVNFDVADVCENESAIFINKSTDANWFNWKFGDGNFSDKQSPNHLFKINGISRTFNVKLVAKVSEYCKDSIIKQVTVNSNPNSDFSFLSINNKVEFKAAQSGNTYYKWLFGNGDSSLTKDVTYHYPISGIDTVCLKVANAAGCISQTCKEVAVTVGITAQINPNNFIIYPNPNSGIFTVDNSSTYKVHTIEILNSIGQIVYKSELTEVRKTLDLNLPTGIYLIKIISDKAGLTQKMVIRR
jgi:PKD repeat protein